jgi:hypothetical protein
MSVPINLERTQIVASLDVAPLIVLSHWTDKFNVVILLAV